MPATRRPAVPGDAAALTELYADYDTLEFGEPIMELADVTSMLGVGDGAPHVVVSDERLIGFVDVHQSGEVETVVDPAHPGARDLQRELLAWTVDQARAQELTRLEHWAGDKPEGAAVLLSEAGFAHARTQWRMVRPNAHGVPNAAWPAHVQLRDFDRDRDAAEVWSVVQTAFAGMFGSHRRPLDEWVRLVLDRGYEPVCAVAGDAIVGVATRLRREDEGHVGQLAVLPDHRGHGIALALLHECFRLDAIAGLPRTTLTVDGENDTAKRLYEKAGMQATMAYCRWERDL